MFKSEIKQFSPLRSSSHQQALSGTTAEGRRGDTPPCTASRHGKPGKAAASLLLLERVHAQGWDRALLTACFACRALKASAAFSWSVLLRVLMPPVLHQAPCGIKGILTQSSSPGGAFSSTVNKHSIKLCDYLIGLCPFTSSASASGSHKPPLIT